MSVKTVRFRPYNTIDLTRGPSPAVWYDYDALSYREDASLGMDFWDDFDKIGEVNMSSAVAGALPPWSVYGYAGALASDGAKEGGVLVVGSDGDNEGVTLFSATSAFRFLTTSTLALNQKMWFETRIARSSVATAKGDFFVGLCAPPLTSSLPVGAIPITTTDDTLATTNDFFGFHLNSSSGTRGGPTEVSVAFELASGTVNYPTNLTTLMASTGNPVLVGGTFVKLGWVFDPTGAVPARRVTSPTARQTLGQLAKPLIRFFVNGVEVPTFLTSDDVVNATSGQAFPTAFMTPLMQVMNTTGSSPPTMSIDWIKCGQIANT